MGKLPILTRKFLFRQSSCTSLQELNNAHDPVLLLNQEFEEVVAEPKTLLLRPALCCQPPKAPSLLSPFPHPSALLMIHLQALVCQNFLTNEKATSGDLVKMPCFFPNSHQF